MNQLTDAGYTAYVGIDWAAAKHDICVQAAAGGRVSLLAYPASRKASECLGAGSLSALRWSDCRGP